ncbi:glycosyltransferase family 4 protein [Massilia sp. TWP1-3-3]|uniref:glycosyltransferase family 4 protein n=1 Tax=Massilia sp. TWP1-3-3 TaxID=2804573 RepID=UPI003CF0321F
MNILMMGWELPPYISGGLGTACAGILKCLNENTDLDIQYLIPHVKGAEEAFGAKLVPLSNGHDFRDFSSSTSAYETSSILPASKYLESVVCKYNSLDKFDVIHAHDWMTFPAAGFLKLASGRPLIVHLHSIEEDRSPGCPNSTILELERRGLNAADQIVAVSQYTKQRIIDAYSIDEDKIAVVHNVVFLEEASVRTLPSQKTVSFIGRITSQKGPVLFVEAALEMLAADDELAFIMAGDGDQLPLVKSIVRSNNLSHRFFFPGFVDRNEVREILSRSSVYVMPSLSEPFGIGAIEAINSHVPVVASSFCGFTEVIRNVVVVAPLKPGDIASACLELMADRVASDKLANAAFDELMKLRPALAANSLAQLYAYLCTQSQYQQGFVANV